MPIDFYWFPRVRCGHIRDPWSGNLGVRFHENLKTWESENPRSISRPPVIPRTVPTRWIRCPTWSAPGASPASVISVTFINHRPRRYDFPPNGLRRDDSRWGSPRFIFFNSPGAPDDDSGCVPIWAIDRSTANPGTCSQTSVFAVLRAFSVLSWSTTSAYPNHHVILGALLNTRQDRDKSWQFFLRPI